MRNVTIPAEALIRLGEALRDVSGPESATDMLQRAGFAAGEAFFAELARETGDDPARLSPDRFWKALDDFLDVRGWGRVTQERVHPAFGLIRTSGWAEGAPEGGDASGGCVFSSGFLAHLFGRVADGPIAVLEVHCQTRGDADCSFLVGSEGAIHEAYEHLSGGASLDHALDRL